MSPAHGRWRGAERATRANAFFIIAVLTGLLWAGIVGAIIALLRGLS